MASTLGVDNPFRYRGYYYDTETGLYYLESHYYNQELGRMMSADSLSVLGMSKTTLNDKNLYNCCDGNPVRDRGKKSDKEGSAGCRPYWFGIRGFIRSNIWNDGYSDP